MNEQYQIFNELKDYEVKPPEEIMIHIFNTLKVDFKKDNELLPAGQLSQLQELEINPPVAAYSAIEQRIITSFQLLFLKDIAVAPPVDIYNSIIEKIEKEKARKKSGGSVLISTFNRYKLAAAVILIITGAWFIYQYTSKPVKPAIETVKNAEPAAPVKNDSVLSPANTITPDKNIAATHNKKAIKKGIKDINQDEMVMMSIDDYNFPVLNNDLLAAFTSFNYNQLPPFLKTAEPKSFSVRIDQFTSISVSENMSKMLRRMNQYRNNGSLKSRAKRTRARLEKWKKADTEQFDKSLINNPVDPLDLAEFIFKY